MTLAAILGMTGAWAQDTDDNVAVTKTANNNEWTLTMPASDVELQVEYYATQPVPTDCRKYAKSLIEFNNLNTFNNVTIFEHPRQTGKRRTPSLLA